MSFNLFLYYCAIFGAYAALSAAFISRLVTQSVTSELLQSVIDGALVGALISFAVGVLDTVWSTGKSDIKRLVIRSLGAGFVVFLVVFWEALRVRLLFVLLVSNFLF